MILTIDIGNTNKKYSLFCDQKMIDHGDYSEKPTNQEIKKTLISCVSSLDIIFDFPHTRIKELIKNNTLLDMPILYSHSIGEDRLASAYYIFKNENGRNLIIDSGSFTTLDIVSKKGFEGGVILPGFDLLKKTYLQGELLQSFVSHFSLNIERSILLLHKNKLATNTAEAISDGMALSFMAPIIEFIKQHQPNKVFLTGGNAGLISQLFFKNGFIVKEKLIHHGLHLIAKEMMS